MTNKKRCVLITGGSRGLGLAFVQDLLEQGYRVATCSRQLSAAISNLKETHEERQFLWAACTIGNESDEASFFAKVEAWSSEDGIYAVVNNAGIAIEGIIATFPNTESSRIIEVNLLGALRLSRLALRHMLSKQEPGRIINISSIIGSRGYTGLAAYSASKAGLDGLTRALAREVGRRQITVNSIAPGYLKTEMSVNLSASQHKQIVNRTPLGRLGEVGDVAPVLRFLLSDGAAFLTGQTITVDGGITT